MIKTIPVILMLLPVIAFSQNQPSKPQNDVTTPLHLMQPNYETPYNVPATAGITKVLDRVYNYLEAATPAQLTNDSKSDVSDFSKINGQTIFKQGDFRLIS